MVVHEADVRRMLAEIHQDRTLDEWQAWFEQNANPIKEMGERRAWPRTPFWRDVRMMLWPGLIVLGVALVFLAMFALALDPAMVCP